jgi:hypothetical protein
VGITSADKTIAYIRTSDVDSRVVDTFTFDFASGNFGEKKIKMRHFLGDLWPSKATCYRNHIEYII